MKIRRLFLPLAAFLLLPAAAWAYRPFVSTDAAVADVKELEIEIGYFNLERNKGNSTFIIPQAVLNYGVIHNLELVAEFAVEEPRHSSTRLVDFALSLKAVLKEGILQEKDGVSFAVEAGALLPSTNKEEKRFGFQGIGILSGRLAPLTAHVNFGGGVDRAHHNPFVVWGVIAELPVAPTFRLVGRSTARASAATPARVPVCSASFGRLHCEIYLSTLVSAEASPALRRHGPSRRGSPARFRSRPPKVNDRIGAGGKSRQRAI
ncbi:MAG TPA: hypothetical protein VGA73_17910 [Candidatus Binatia bacterium]